MSRPAALVGRSRELAALAAARGRVTLHGPPGVGKSSLVRAARGAAAVVVDLSLVSVTDPIDALSRALDGRPIDEIAAWLAATGRTLVLDGLERWGAERSRGLVEAIGPAELLVTAHAPLGFEGETCLAIGPLEHGDATALFVALAGDEARELVDAAGGWPLALELLATLTRSLGAATVRRHLPALLSTSPVVCSIEAAQATLGDDERAALLALSVAPAPLPISIVATLSSLPTARAMSATAGLVDRGLARVRDDEASVLDVVRDTALAHVTQEARDAAERAHARWARELLRGHPWGHGGVDSADAFRLLRARRAHLEVAFERSLASRPDDAARLALDLDPLYVLEGATDAHMARLERASEATTDATLRAELAARQGRTAVLQGANGVAFSLVAGHPETLPVATRARLASVEAPACVGLGDLASAERAATRVLEIAVAIDAPGERDRLLAYAHQMRAICAAARGEVDQALGHYDAAISLARRRGATRLLALALANASELPGLTGDVREARIREAHALFVDVGDRPHVTKLDLWLVRLAPVAEREARLAWVAARAEELADHAIRAAAWLDVCELAWARGDRSAATRAFASARVALARTDDAETHARATKLTAALTGDAAPKVLRLRRDGGQVVWSDRTIELANRRALPRLMLALVRDAAAPGGRGLDVMEMFAAGWPGERASVSSLSARVHVAVRTLRTMGIEGGIVTRQGRYALAEGVSVVWMD